MTKVHASLSLVLLLSGCAAMDGRCVGDSRSIEELERAARLVILSGDLPESSALLGALNSGYITAAAVAVDGLASGDDNDRRYVCNLLARAHPMLRTHSNVPPLRTLNRQLAQKASCEEIQNW